MSDLPWQICDDQLFSFCGYLAVADVMLLVVVAAKIMVVMLDFLHVGLVKHRAGERVIYVWRDAKCVLDDVRCRAPPFDDQNEAVDQWRRGTNVDNRRERRKIDDNVVKGCSQFIEQLFGFRSG